jgi:energy-coupling factor transporter transmembrane protein EcfT
MCSFWRGLILSLESVLCSTYPSVESCDQMKKLLQPRELRQLLVSKLKFQAKWKFGRRDVVL